MAIEGLNHFNLRAPQPLLGLIRDFYVEVVGLVEGDRPDFGVPGHWLYAGGHAVVHLLESESSDATTATGVLDHIAFTCNDLGAVEQRLETAGVDYQKREFPHFGLSQLFLNDPSGLGVELNFATDTDRSA